MFIFYKPACLQKYLHGRVLSIRVFSADGHYGLIVLGSLSTRVFETRTATGSELFSLLTCLHTTAFALPSIFSPLEMLGIKIWETPLSRHAKCPLPVDVRVSKTCVLKLPIVSPRTNTIASRDRTKPIRIGENLVVNYKG